MTRAELDRHLMLAALEEARAAALEDEVPVGAVVAIGSDIIAREHNRMRQHGDPTAHAEVLVIRGALAALQQRRGGSPDSSGYRGLEQCTLVVSLEPCAMCAGAIVLSRVDRLVFGAWDDRAGMCGSVGDIVRHHRLNHKPQVQAGTLAAESAGLLHDFFASCRIRGEASDTR